MDQHRPPGVRAAVAQRQRSQGRLRAVTATVGAGGVATAGAVAFILPGATHATASTRPASTPRPTPAASSPAVPAASGSGAAGTRQARRHRHHHSHRNGAAAGSAGAASAPSAPAAASSAPAPVPSTSPPQTTSGGS